MVGAHSSPPSDNSTDLLHETGLPTQLLCVIAVVVTVTKLGAGVAHRSVHRGCW
jgi:hypothetical protein